MRDYDIESDLKQEKFQHLKLVQGDRGNKIKINVYEDGQPVNLTGCSITAKYKRADGQVINGSVTNISNNSFDAVIDSDITKTSGVLKMLFAIEKDDVKVSTFMLLADVREGIGESTGSSGGSTGGGEVTVDLSNYYKKSETYSKSQIDSQFKDIANNQPTDLSLDSATNLLQLVNSKGSKLGNGIILPISSGGGTNQYLHIKYSSTGAPQLAGQMSDTPNTYIGLCVDTNADAPINPHSYTWYKWKGEDGAKGDTGATPQFAIGEVTTLDSGSNATASITGTTENPLLNLGIPRGEGGTGGSEKEWELLHTIEITEETTYIHQDINPTKENILIIYEDVWSNVSGAGLSIAINGLSCGASERSVSEGVFVNSETYKSKGFIIIEKLPVGFMVQFGGKNSAGNENAGSVGSAHYLSDENSNNLNVINHIMVSLNGFVSKHIMGGTFKIYGR